MKNTIKLLLIVFALSAVTFTSCKKEDFKNIIEKIKEGDKDKGDKDGDKDDKDRDKGDKDKGDKDGDKDDKDRDKGDKDKGRGGRNNDKDSTRRR